MYAIQPKKMNNLNILKILENHSDENHPLTQQDIIRYLKAEYGMDIERKAVVRNIDYLLDEGYDINFTEQKRGKGKGKNVIRSNFYINRDFTHAELRYLIDGLLFSNYVPPKQCADLIKKLKELGNEFFNSREKNILAFKESHKVNKDLFYTIEQIDESINEHKMLQFNHCDYNIDKKQECKKDENGKDKVYLVSPYRMLVSNGRYYLLCHYDKYEGLSHFRIDRIKNAKVSDRKSKPLNLNAPLNISNHMLEHIYMFGGENANVKFEFDEKHLNDVIDWFGTDIILSKSRQTGKLIAQTRVNLNAMKFWALQYGLHVKVLSPEKLKKEIISDLNTVIKKYKMD